MNPKRSHCRSVRISILTLALLWPASRGLADELPELTVNDIVSRWAEASQGELRFACGLECFEYDAMLAIETRNQAMLRADGTGAFDFRQEPAIINEEMTSAKLTADGVPYDLRSGSTYSMLWSSELVMFNNSTILSRSALADDWLANRIWEAFATPPLRIKLLLPVNPEELMEQFRWELGELAGSGIHLRGYPRSQHLATGFQRVEVLLDDETWLPVACRELNGDRETVLVVTSRLASPEFWGLQNRALLAKTIWELNSPDTEEAPDASMTEPLLAAFARAAYSLNRAWLHSVQTLLEWASDAYDTVESSDMVL